MPLFLPLVAGAAVGGWIFSQADDAFERIGDYFDPPTGGGITSGIGIGVVIAAGLVALYLWKRQR